ncbi:beta-galactosidase [Butyrivibrio sp. YAB3001]|uniref:beta-galactosidase n=1 Tax=Butyrivibrio sp. YAB3001 TaxID=1520812 RepID=UPI0008F65273|nr:beta-galactosidase [Butyrivibrio sp. YAB3001]SFB75019.1 Glycosyl hydrolases family 35 [Butyrivibrio sp. YAB3001]
MKITKDSVISYDPVSLLVDGKRWFPMMGEMHFSRYPRKNWEEELLKMKAGGIDIVSLYVIWIHHEEIQGEFDFSGDRNLREFLETVKQCGMYSILRIGPWAHGEARNGGFPDWLLKDAQNEGYEVRSNAPKYLEHVRRFYEKTYEQAKGFFIEDNGPVIGIQIENEYGHCGGFGGAKGEEHMRTLKDMAMEIGFITPIYTATGWGGAVTGGMLPVMGGYCEAPWDQRLTEIEPSGNYIFTRERNDHNIGSDHGLGVGITFDMDKFPFLTAELGGGLQVTHHRRPIASGLDTAAMTMVKMGSGANLLGYYMYHGGTNPKGKLTTLQETRETGYPNDLPEYSYDFNAPLREFGQMEDTYREVRMISNFVHDFGSDLCDMPYVPQPGNPLKPDNFNDLRTAVRYKKKKTAEGKEFNSGYLFVNNYQRRYKMEDHRNVVLAAFAEDGKEVLSSFPARDIEDGDFFFYPFNMPVGEKALVTVDATPLCILHDIDDRHHDAYIFYTDNDRTANVNVDGDLDGNKVIVINRKEAVHSSKVNVLGKEHLIISKAEAVTDAEGRVNLLFETDSDDKLTFMSYPALGKEPEGFEKISEAVFDGEIAYSSKDIFTSYESKKIYANPVKCAFKEVAVDNTDTEKECKVFEISALEIPEDANEVYMHVDYAGDKAKLFVDGEIATDSFYTGQTWEIGLKRYVDTEFKGEVVVYPLYSEDKEKMYLQQWPEMEDGVACAISGVKATVQYKVQI